MSVIPAFRSPRQENFTTFKASLGYIGNSGLNIVAQQDSESHKMHTNLQLWEVTNAIGLIVGHSSDSTNHHCMLNASLYLFIISQESKKEQQLSLFFTLLVCQLPTGLRPSDRLQPLHPSMLWYCPHVFAHAIPYQEWDAFSSFSHFLPLQDSKRVLQHSFVLKEVPGSTSEF